MFVISFFGIFITENQPLRLMKFIQGQDRNQTTLFPVSLEQAIDPDNEVRIIDLFVDSLPLKDYGFKADYPPPPPTPEGGEETLVVATHGLIKKTNKTPPAEIRKAEQIKRDYFEEKKKDKKKKSK